MLAYVRNIYIYIHSYLNVGLMAQQKHLQMLIYYILVFILIVVCLAFYDMWELILIAGMV